MRILGRVSLVCGVLALLFFAYRFLRNDREAADRSLPAAHSDAPVASPATDSRIRIAAFNVQVFGRSKASRLEIMEVLARIAREFDVLVVQEIRDASGQVADLFLERINAEPGPAYAMYEGPPLGRSSNTEQYAAYYRVDRVELQGAYILPDPYDLFEREPLVAAFRAGSFDFILVAVHVKPASAYQELQALASVTVSIINENPAERDLILLGDFNADCSYFQENDGRHPLRGPGFHWVITDAMDTNVAPSSCTYDRIVLLDGTYTHEYVPGSAGVFYFDAEYGIPPFLTPQVSDHYPVYAEFRVTLPDDD